MGKTGCGRVEIPLDEWCMGKTISKDSHGKIFILSVMPRSM